MFKLAVFDLDGTLLDDHHHLSQENIEAIKTLHSQGTVIALASGRPKLLMKEVIHRLGVCDYVITCNGSVVENLRTGKKLINAFISDQTTQAIMDLTKINETIFMGYTEDTIVTEYNDRVEIFEKRNETLPDAYKVRFNLVDDIQATRGQYSFNKILLVEKNEVINKNLKDQLACFNDLTVTESNHSFIDLMSKNISKKMGVKIIAQELNVMPYEVVAFGDNYNDLEMLKFAGYAITTSNGVEAVKEIADFITISNNESGVAQGIQYLLECTIVQNET